MGTLVTNVALRNPGLLAKMSSTVDNISGGRLIVGLGTGDRLSRRELLSYGYAFPALAERVERLRETVLILKAMWTQNEATYRGKYLRISRALNLPRPKQRPHPPIWIGGKHARILDVVAELCDGWNHWGLGGEMVRKLSNYLSAKSSEYGRKPEDIVISWAGTYSQIAGRTRNQAELSKNLKSRFREQMEAGTNYFIASLSSGAEMDEIRGFANSMKSMGKDMLHDGSQSVRI